MKSINLSAFVLFIIVLFQISCKKDPSCESCGTNQPPIANSGTDQKITLPKDSVLLDGSASSDPDGTIASYKWIKISGPSSFAIIKPTDSTTKVKALVMGTYQFELKVTDNGGLSAKDTVQITINDPAQVNHPPIANAGPDQTITLPSHAINLDGSGSTDPDNNITNYTWTKISGPSSFVIANSNASQTQITNFIQGIYLFELKVIDAGGLISKDTIAVSINSLQLDPCAANRPFVNAQLIPFTSIPNLIHPGNNQYKIVTAGNKLVFLPEYFYWPGQNPIYIFDIVASSWSTAEFSVPRFGVAIATLGNKIYFAGGGFNDGSSVDTTYNTIDIYDASSNTWAVSSLSIPGYFEDGAVLGNKIFFLSGSLVQIFNTSTGTCTTENLSISRWGGAAVTAGNKVYFAGGYENNFTNGGGISNRVDVYDNSTNNWSQFSLIEPKASMACIFVNDKIFWAGGRKAYLPSDTLSSLVQIFDINTGSSTTSCLHQSRMGLKAVVKNNKIVFFTGQDSPQNKFDIYDIATNSWSIGVLPFNIQFAAIASYNNTIYVAGGVVNGSWTPQVWKLEF